MLRTFIVKKDTDLQTLTGSVLDARFRGAQADNALSKLKALNPHADLGKLRAGTVLFIPDEPGFKASAGPSAQAGPLAEFQQLAANALSQAAQDMKAGSAARAAERAEVAAILKSAVFKRLATADKELAQQADAAAKTMAEEETADKQAEENLAAAGKAALAALANLGKIGG